MLRTCCVRCVTHAEQVLRGEMLRRNPPNGPRQVKTGKHRPRQRTKWWRARLERLGVQVLDLAAHEKTSAVLDLGDPVSEGCFERHEVSVCVEVSVSGGFNEVEAN